MLVLYIFEKEPCIYPTKISLYIRKRSMYISLFLASLRFGVHYCIDRDTIQRKKRAKRGCHLRRQPQKLDIAKLVAPRSEHFRSFVEIFVVYLFSQKTGVFINRK